MQKLLQRIPPHSIESERYVLGAILLDSSVIKQISHLVKDHFYSTIHQDIYKALIDLHNKQQPIDITTLRHALKRRGLLDRVGGEAYLVELEDGVPHALSIDYHVGCVMTEYNKRKQIECATKVIQEAYSTNVDANTSIEELKGLLEKSVTTSDNGIVEPDTLSDKIDAIYKTGLQPGIRTGWCTLDDYYTIKEGQMTLITGIPSHGKSQFSTNLLVNIAERYQWKFAIFSPENQPVQRHAVQMLSMYIKKPFGSNQQITEGELAYAKDWLQRHFVFLDMADHELTIDHILTKAKICVLKHGIKGLVIDPWNEIDHSRPANLSETEYISMCLTKIRRFARMYQVHVWLIVHPMKLQKRIDGTYPVPTPYDISGSAHWRNRADCCLCVWRNIEDGSKEVQIHVQKVRFREVGKVGRVDLYYDYDKGVYNIA